MCNEITEHYIHELTHFDRLTLGRVTFQLRTRNSIRGFVHPSVRWSVGPSVRPSGVIELILFAYVRVLGVGFGVDGGRMPLPTRPQRYCDPASLVHSIIHSSQIRTQIIQNQQLRTGENIIEPYLCSRVPSAQHYLPSAASSAAPSGKSSAAATPSSSLFQRLTIEDDVAASQYKFLGNSGLKVRTTS